ncbi:MAG: hypothetical protein K2X29_11380, partial [Candidatus Obscuribacterales bacterium]|nr:hypothetical protein [Candidatus Obscuribacterales bacterium]
MRVLLSLCLLLSLTQTLPALSKHVDHKQVKKELQEQAEEKDELKKMRDELNDLKSTIMDGSQAMGALQSQVAEQAKTRQ